MSETLLLSPRATMMCLLCIASTAKSALLRGRVTSVEVERAVSAVAPENFEPPIAVSSRELPVSCFKLASIELVFHVDLLSHSSKIASEKESVKTFLTSFFALN
jgi:hypothetical protein